MEDSHPCFKTKPGSGPSDTITFYMTNGDIHSFQMSTLKHTEYNANEGSIIFDFGNVRIKLYGIGLKSAYENFVIPRKIRSVSVVDDDELESLVEAIQVI